MKKILSLILAIISILSLAACGNNSQSENNDKQNEINDKQAIENAEVKESEQEADANQNAVQTEKETTTQNVINVLTTGESASTEKCEFKIDYIDITNDVMPKNPDNYYSHYLADDGKAYVDLCIAYKNIESKDIDADATMSGKLMYANKYEYTGFSIIEEQNRSDFTYSNISSIAPLTTEYMHYLFEVPEEVKNSKSSINLEMNIGGQDFVILVRGEES